MSQRAGSSRLFPTALLAAALLAPIVFGGCAIMNRDNTPLLNLVEENLWPDSTGMRIATFPVVFPAGAVAVVLDMVIVHPAMIVDDSLGDTGDVLWDNWEWDEKYVTECACLPWRALFTPIVFGGNFIGRALFDFPERADAEREASKEAARREAEARIRTRLRTLKPSLDADLEKVEELIDGGRYSEALDRVTNLIAAVDLKTWLLLDKKTDHLARAQYLSLAAAAGSGRYDAIGTHWALKLKDAYKKETESILSEMGSSRNPLARWTALVFGIELACETHEKIALAHRSLKDPDAAVRQSALWGIKQCGLDGVSDLLVKDLRRIIADDADPINRALAADLMRWVIED